MAVTPFKTFSAGEILTASDLNASFSQVFDNGEDLAWPATQARDFNGVELILDADGDTSITADTDDQIDFKLAGTDYVSFRQVATDHAVNIVGTVQTTGNVVDIGDADALTTGSILNLVSNSASTGTRSLVQITNDNTAATGTTPVSIQQDAADDSIFIDQNGNGQAIRIDSEATTADILNVSPAALTTGNVINVPDADALTTGSILNLVSNSADTTPRNLVFVHNNNALATDAMAVRIRQDAANQALFVDQVGNGVALTVNTSATTANGQDILADLITTGVGLNISCDALTTGSALAVESNSASTATRNIISFVNDNALATEATLLSLQQDAPATAINIDVNADTSAIAIDSDATTATAISVQDFTLTTGSMVGLASASSSSASRALVDILNVSSSATGTIPLSILQAAANEAVLINQDGNGSAILIDSEATTATVLSIPAAATTSGDVISASANSITTGKLLNLTSGSTDSSSRNLARITNSSSSATGTNCLHLLQQAAHEVLRIEQNATAAGSSFIDFNGTVAANTTGPISSLTTSGSTTHHIQIEINGTKAWIAASTTNPS